MKKCNLCDSFEIKFLFEKNFYKIGKCKTCGLIFVLDEISDEDLKKVYSKGYFTGENDMVYRNYEADKEGKIAEFVESLKEIEKWRSKGKILDVGCALGFFLDVARKSNWETFGVEISKHAVKYAVDKLGLNVFEGELKDANFQPNYFDVITFWDNIEHLRDPSATLMEANRILKKDGLIVITTANAAGINAKFFGKKWIIYAPPWHLYYFSYHNIQKLLSKANFKIEYINIRGILLYNSNYTNNDFLTNFLLKVSFGKIGRFLSNNLKLGTNMTIFAKKIDTERKNCE